MSDLSPDQFPPDSFSSEMWLLKLSGMIGAMFVIFKFFKKVYAGVKDIFNTASRVKHIINELAPENGKSLKDIVLNMKDTVKAVNHRQILTEHRERAVLQESSFMMFEFNEVGALKWANKQYCTFTGRTIEELHDRGWENTISQEDRERVIKEFSGAERSDRDFESKYTIINEKTQVAHKVICRATVIKDSSTNEAIGWIGIVKPIN
jgi:PAS domain S-box-containing protein